MGSFDEQTVGSTVFTIARNNKGDRVVHMCIKTVNVSCYGSLTIDKEDILIFTRRACWGASCDLGRRDQTLWVVDCQGHTIKIWYDWFNLGDRRRH